MKNKIIFAFFLMSFFLFSIHIVHAQQNLLLTKTLQVGSTGVQVTKLQTFLKQFPDIYPEGVVNGNFGLLTKNAVIRFQTKIGIKPELALGIVDLATRTQLNKMASVVNPKFPNTSATSAFTQTINPGTLTVDIVNGSYVTVGAPSFAMTAATLSFTCQTVTGTFGSGTQNIYVKNPDAADNSWTVSLAASVPTAIWTSAGTGYDFNDPTTAGCTDGADAGDTLAGQMTVNPAVGTLTVGQCLTCTLTSVTKGSSSSFNQGTLDSLTILSAAAASDDIGDWKLTGVAISQTIPAEQHAASDYTINLVLSIVGT